MIFFCPKTVTFSVMGIRKIINSLPLCRKIASQFSSSAYVRIIYVSKSGSDPYYNFFLRRYQMERKIFEELLELKRLQIRAGRANEQLLVKRLSDSYGKTVQNLVGLHNYDGPFTFKEFEKYLYSKSSYIIVGFFANLKKCLPFIPIIIVISYYY
jgi:hypothetical protein